ncbi:MAG: hypothetical protein IIC74_09625 [Bacteroidetes bacterium]|nr:hypothetical protein [Bacteroidota bacterium]
MKTNIAIIVIAIFSINIIDAQEKMEEKLPYYEIPEYPETYTAGTVAARMIDGLGFRYYWATEGLRDEDLAYKPSEDARTTAETLDHIYGLSKIIVNATLKKPNSRAEEPEMTFAEKRKKTLENIKTAADILRTSTDVSEFKIVFGLNEYPFWNQINGPIEDAVWHCGQVVSFRRSSGNPFNSKANVFTGKVKE